MVGEAMGIRLAEFSWELRDIFHFGIALRVDDLLQLSRQRYWLLQVEPVQRVPELLLAEERAARRTGRHRRAGEGALGERREAVLQGERAGQGEEAPFVELAPGDLAARQRLDDFAAVLA